MHIETLENLNNPTYRGHLVPDDKTLNVQEPALLQNSISSSEAKNDRKQIEHEPAVKNISIRENQTGVSYKTLFGSYLKGATLITIEDPYIRLPYQIRNFLELMGLIAEQKEMEDEVNVHLVTWNSEDRTPESIDAFDEIKESVSEVGINLTYEFKEFHDRKIITDNGWEIILGRGLDIFEPRRGYSIEEFIQERRKCKAFTVTYLKESN